MSRGGRHLELHRQEALLRHTDQRGRLGQPRQHAFGNQQPFVDHEIETLATRLEQRGDLLGATVATHFLVSTKGQVDGATRLEAAGGQQLNGLHL